MNGNNKSFVLLIFLVNKFFLSNLILIQNVLVFYKSLGIYFYTKSFLIIGTSYLYFLLVGSLGDSYIISISDNKSPIVNFSILFFISSYLVLLVPSINGIIIIGLLTLSLGLPLIISLTLPNPDFLIVYFFPEAWIEFNAA